MSGATFDPPPGGGPPRPPFTGGLPNTVGAQVDNSGLINSAVLLMIQAWNENTAQLSALLNTVGGTITGDVSGNLPGPVQVTATHLAAPLPIAQGGTGNALGQALPIGAAGGDLGGTYPSPSVTSTTLSAPLPVAQGGTGIGSGTSGGIIGFTAVGVVGSSALLAQNQLVVGGGAGVLPSTIGSLGTVNTILHGNAAGLPGYGPVATADISNSAVTFGKIQNETAGTILGNLTGGAAAPSENAVTGTGNVVLSAAPTLTGTTQMASLALSGEAFVSRTDGITALVGGGRTGAPTLASQMNRIAVVASASDSVQFPAAVAGDFRVVINDGANIAQIFANGTDTIDGVAGAVGVPLTNGFRIFSMCLASGQWQTLRGPVSS